MLSASLQQPRHLLGNINTSYLLLDFFLADLFSTHPFADILAKYNRVLEDILMPNHHTPTLFQGSKILIHEQWCCGIAGI